MTRNLPECDLDLIVSDKCSGADGVALLQLRKPDGTDLPSWTPGAHIDLELTSDITRQYSLCGSPADRDTWRIGVLREPASRGGSLHVHDTLAVGDTVRVRGPRNHFELTESENYLFIAGGIGITPIITMVAEAERRGAGWSLAYGGRSRDSMAFVDELVSRYPGNTTVVPQDEKGLLDLDDLLGTARVGTAVYCCGPGPLLDAVTERAGHWPEGSVHLERFRSDTLDRPTPDASFEVELSVSGRTVTVHPDESVLDAVTNSGVQVLSSCREGTCGTCETAVLAGTVDHRDTLLTEEERGANDTMMICVSRSTGPRLVLEL